MTGQLTGVGLETTGVPRETPGAPQLRDQELASLAARQYGVIARGQLLALGVKSDAIDYRLKTKRLHVLHRGVYALGHNRLPLRGRWLAAVLACGDHALLSHHQAAALWGLRRGATAPIHISSRSGRGRSRKGLVVHEAQIHREDCAVVDAIPVTSVARTLLDLACVSDEQSLERAFEEADRQGLLTLASLERSCRRGRGRKGTAALRKLLLAAREPIVARSALEERFARFCLEHKLPPPSLNCSVLDFEVDALWPQQRLIVELDGFAFHRHRAAFERDRARDGALQAAGYRVIRLTHRRLEENEGTVAEQLRRLLLPE